MLLLAAGTTADWFCISDLVLVGVNSEELLSAIECDFIFQLLEIFLFL